MTNAIVSFSSAPKKTESQVDFLLIDGSGSMQPKWWDTLDAIEAYVTGLKAAGVQTHITASVFDSNNIADVQFDAPIANWKSMKEQPFGGSWGRTPLYDAINHMGRWLAERDPPRCAITIATDGESTSSITSLDQAKAILDWCRAKGWQITFIGVDFRNSEEAAKLGASAASAIGVQQKLLADAATALAKKRAAYGQHGTPIHYTDGEKQQFGGYLNGPAGGAK